MAKYSAGAGKKVQEVMDEMKEGKLKIGRSNKKVTDRKQAIAIALSEAKKAGSKVPPNPDAKKQDKKKTSETKKKAASKKKAAPKKNTAAKKEVAPKKKAAATKKRASKK